MTARTRAPGATNTIEFEPQPGFVGTMTWALNLSGKRQRRFSPSG
jgi:hypothetical protein